MAIDFTDMRKEVEGYIQQDYENPELWKLYVDVLNAQGDPQGKLVELILSDPQAKNRLEHSSELNPPRYILARQVFDTLPISDISLCNGTAAELRYYSLNRLEVLQDYRLALIRYIALGLAHYKLGYSGIGAVIDCPYLEKVTTLNLSYNLLGSRSVLKLMKSPYLLKLKELYICHNKIGNMGVKIIVQSQRMSNITKLDLRANKIGDDGAIALARSPHCSNLAYLNLGENQITDEGAIALANSPHLSKLTTLALFNNKITRRGFHEVNISTYLKKEVTDRFRVDN